MAEQIPEDVLELMLNLSGEQHDIIVKRWLEQQKQLKEYKDKYVGQKSNIVLGNRLLAERKSIPTPDQEAARLHQELIDEAKKLEKENADKERQTELEKSVANDNQPEKRDTTISQFKENKPHNPNVISLEEKQRIREETLRKLKQSKDNNKDIGMEYE